MSATEARDLAKLAARGAGAHAAQAEHFGRALIAHLGAGRDPSHLEAALADLPEGPIQVLPFAASADATDSLAQTYWALRNRTKSEAYVAPRVDVPDALCALLTRLAEKTYVPATDASRLSGAGAGLEDND